MKSRFPSCVTGHDNPASFPATSFPGRATQAFRGGGLTAAPPISPREKPGPRAWFVVVTGMAAQPEFPLRTHPCGWEYGERMSPQDLFRIVVPTVDTSRTAVPTRIASLIPLPGLWE